MTTEPTAAATDDSAPAELLPDEEHAEPPPTESEAAPTAGAAVSRAAGPVSYVGGALVLAGLLALIFTWVTDFTGLLALLGVSGAVALALSWATRRLRPSAVSDVLAGIAAVELSLFFDTVLDAAGLVIDPAPRWILFCAPSVLIGGALCWWVRSNAAGAWAVAAWVVLPLALVTGSEERLGFALPFTATVSHAAVWAALALTVLAVTLAEQGARFAARRGWVDPASAVWTAFIASSVLGVVLVIAAMVESQSWFYFALVAGAALATGFSVWRREWAWLPTASRLYSTAAVTALTGIHDGPGQAMGLVVLSLSFFTFAPLARRLPDHLSVRFWEATIWVMGFAASCAFALAPGGWPAAGGVWAAAVVVLAVTQQRILATVLGALALYVVFIVQVIDAFGAVTGAGFGTISFGLVLLIVVIVWQQQLATASVVGTLRSRLPR